MNQIAVWQKQTGRPKLWSYEVAGYALQPKNKIDATQVKQIDFRHPRIHTIDIYM